MVFVTSEVVTGKYLDMLTCPFYAWCQYMTLFSGTEEAQAEVQIVASVSLRSSGMCKHLNTLENISLRNRSAELMSVGL